MGYQTEIYGRITCNHKEAMYNKNILNQYGGYPYYKENFTFITNSYSFAMIVFGASIKVNESEVIDNEWKEIVFTNFENILKKMKFVYSTIHVENEFEPSSLSVEYYANFLNSSFINKTEYKIKEEGVKKSKIHLKE
ncbi:hypothetical protein WAF17_00620 [Bernardetia sp. ABR2-2B]|uniref:hypothetical protein n=1 Tax=Bernardetia sp. ABR2-2B TaxID=3127472 RepID=UPI0030D586E2